MLEIRQIRLKTDQNLQKRRFPQGGVLWETSFGDLRSESSTIQTINKTRIPRWAMSLPLEKTPKLWGFWQNYKILQYTTLGQRIFFNFQILFFTPFCNLKRYFCVVWQFYTQILTKIPKIKKTSKIMRFLTKLQNTSIYNFGSKEYFQFSDFVFHPFL